MNDTQPPPAVRGADPAPGAREAAQRPAGDAPQRLDSRQLFGTQHVVEIDHAGTIYRLRRTALGKLILTK